MARKTAETMVVALPMMRILYDFSFAGKGFD